MLARQPYCQLTEREKDRVVTETDSATNNKELTNETPKKRENENSRHQLTRSLMMIVMMTMMMMMINVYITMLNLNMIR